METAISAAEHSRRSDTDKLRRRLTHGPHFFTPKAVAVVPVKDSEGSIKYKRRRRKHLDSIVSSNCVLCRSTNFSFSTKEGVAPHHLWPRSKLCIALPVAEKKDKKYICSLLYRSNLLSQYVRYSIILLLLR